MDSEESIQSGDRNRLNVSIYLLACACALFAAADWKVDKHAHFKIEEWFAFYGWFAFGVGLCLILAALVIGKLLRREEDYYDR